MRRSLYYIFILTLIILGGVALGRFWVENAEPAQLMFLEWRTKPTSMASLIIISFSVGVVLSSTVLTGSMLSKFLEAKRLRRENTALQKMMELKEK
ncbi:MAG: hypothetical protein COV44_10820 [Deltaproteobacteria bacterium CG11_big_fil_rev_8_21_14_0_20_45_16]|nr:MAG: hypothetical protein COV44_10820 [Deltaproteobacteria bacterium CG11_big_fil_rev_8_21_14_0_20_45_16]